MTAREATVTAANLEYTCRSDGRFLYTYTVNFATADESTAPRRTGDGLCGASARVFALTFLVCRRRSHTTRTRKIIVRTRKFQRSIDRLPRIVYAEAANKLCKYFVLNKIYNFRPSSTSPCFGARHQQSFIPALDCCLKSFLQLAFLCIGSVVKQALVEDFGSRLRAVELAVLKILICIQPSADSPLITLTAHLEFFVFQAASADSASTNFWL